MITNLRLPNSLKFALVLIFSAFSTLVQGTVKPNIIIIITDDAGYSDYGFSGRSNFQTPNIDSISETGIHFPQAYVSASVCSPSRAGLITGRNQQRFGYFDNLPRKLLNIYQQEYAGIPETEITLAEALKQAGYKTSAIGKWHLGYGDKFHPNRHGFDYFYGIESGSRSYWPNKKGFGPAQENGKPVQDEGYFTDTLTNKAIKYIRQQGKQPYFMYLSYTAPHTPLHAKAEHLALFSHIANKQRRALAAMTYSLDENIGKVLNSIDRENTLIFFINDNGGTESNSQGNRPLTGYKGTVLEGGLRVPFAISWPGAIEGGRVSQQVASSLDIFATAVAAAGSTLAQDREYDGQNLLPHMAGKSLTPRPRKLYWKRHGYAAIRDGDYKLLRLSDRPALLFNVNRDPGELNNVALQHPEKVTAMLKSLWAWEQKHQHPKWQTNKKFNNEYLDKLDRAFGEVSKGSN